MPSLKTYLSYDSNLFSVTASGAFWVVAVPEPPRCQRVEGWVAT